MCVVVISINKTFLLQFAKETNFVASKKALAVFYNFIKNHFEDMH